MHAEQDPASDSPKTPNTAEMQASAHGALLIDKPAGITSAGVLRALKRIAPKLGHAGTLDPNATGLLVVLVNKATRLQALVTGSEKVYEGTIKLGVKTETDDVWGTVIETSAQQSVFTTEEEKQQLLDELRAEFSGGQSQVPPQVSAVKVQGVRNYRRVRDGAGVALASREIEVEFCHLDFSGPLELQYRVRCSKGTYIRGLARDIGEFLGVGGCVASIRRLESGPFSVEHAHSIEAVKDQPLDSLLIPLEVLAAGLRQCTVTPSDMARLSNGQQQPLSQFTPPEEPSQAALRGEDGRFLGLIEAPAGGGWKIGFLV